MTAAAAGRAAGFGGHGSREAALVKPYLSAFYPLLAAGVR
jgi:hypothetical protein